MRTLAGAILALLLVPAAAGARPAVQAHRGGSVLDGVPTYPENTLPGFENAARHGWVAEMDAKVTKDGVPVIIHDDSLDRTTACTGLVVDVTLADLQRRCRSDVLGSPGDIAPSKATRPTVPLPTVAAVLASLKRLHGRVSLEIKNYPTDKDFDPTYAAARKILAVIKASRFPLDHLIIQSFTQDNLREARTVFPKVTTAQLLFKGQSLESGLMSAAQTNASFLSPPWPLPDPGYVTGAHRAGKQVVPYTLDTPSEVRGATIAGVDALITDDPAMATREIARAPFDLVRLGLTTRRPGASSGFSLRLRQPASAGAVVPAPRSLSLSFPKGTVVDTRIARPGAVLGRGSATVAEGSGPKAIQLVGKVTLVAGRDGRVLLKGSVDGVGGTLRGRALALTIPRRQLEGGGEEALVALTLSVPARSVAGRVLLRTPRACPRGRNWALSGRVGFDRPLGPATLSDVSRCR